MQWDPADLTRFRSDRAAAAFVVDDPAEAGGPPAGRSRPRRLLAVALVLVLAGAVGVAVVLLRPSSGGPTPAAPALVSAPTPTPRPSPPPPPSRPPVSTAPSEAAVVASVDRILAITYPSRVSALTAQDERRILELVREPLAPGQRVLVSGFAGYDWATKEGARAMSRARAATIQRLLARHGVPSTVIAYGDTPADSVLGAAMAEAVPAGDTENLLAFVSIAVMAPGPAATKQ